LSWVTGYLVNGASTRALRIRDDTEEKQAKVTGTGVASNHKTLEFAFRSWDDPMPSAFLFTVTGPNASGARVTSYELAVNPNGSVSRYIVSPVGWTTLAPAGTVPVTQWSTLRVEATLSQATFSVDGAVEAHGIPPSGAGAKSLEEYTFASSGTKPATGQFLIDDVLFE
jgi:hypothetical protein